MVSKIEVMMMMIIIIIIIHQNIVLISQESENCLPLLKTYDVTTFFRERSGIAS